MGVTDREIELLYEIGCLRFIPRMWQRFLNADFANLADHHMRVAWTALLIANHEGAGNTDKILKMALVHDIAESRTGDADYLARQYTQRNEDLGLRDMVAGTVLESEMIALFREYEAHESIEAKIVKDADNLDVDFEIQEQRARGVQLQYDYIWNEARQYAYDHKLSTETAKQLWKKIRQSDPNDWHLRGRTRRNAGDWSMPNN